MSFISLDDIVFVEGDSAYSIFHLVNQKKLVISKTLSFVEELLDEPYFFRVHKSYMVALNKIESVEKDMIKIKTHLIPISDTFKKLFFEQILPSF